MLSQLNILLFAHALLLNVRMNCSNPEGQGRQVKENYVQKEQTNLLTSILEAVKIFAKAAAWEAGGRVVGWGLEIDGYGIPTQKAHQCHNFL